MNMTSNAYMVSPQSKGRPDLVKFKRIRWHSYAYVVIWGMAIIILSGLSSLYLSEFFGAFVRLFRFNQPKTLFSSENLDESLQEFSLK